MSITIGQYNALNAKIVAERKAIKGSLKQAKYIKEYAKKTHPYTNPASGKNLSDTAKTTIDTLQRQLKQLDDAKGKGQSQLEWGDWFKSIFDGIGRWFESFRDAKFEVKEPNSGENAGQILNAAAQASGKFSEIQSEASSLVADSQKSGELEADVPVPYPSMGASEVVVEQEEPSLFSAAGKNTLTRIERYCQYQVTLLGVQVKNQKVDQKSGQALIAKLERIGNAAGKATADPKAYAEATKKVMFGGTTLANQDMMTEIEDQCLDGNGSFSKNSPIQQEVQGLGSDAKTGASASPPSPR